MKLPALLGLLFLASASQILAQVPNTSSGRALVPLGMAMNRTTGLIYSVSQTEDTLLVRRGGSNAILATVSVGARPVAVAVNKRTGQSGQP